jgi:hypothetical protein
MAQNQEPTGQLWVLPKGGIFSRDLRKTFPLPGNICRKLRAHLRNNFQLAAYQGDLRNFIESIVFLAESATLEVSKMGLYEFLRDIVKSGAMTLTLGLPSGPDDDGGGGTPLPKPTPRKGSFLLPSA